MIKRGMAVGLMGIGLLYVFGIWHIDPNWGWWCSVALMPLYVVGFFVWMTIVLESYDSRRFDLFAALIGLPGAGAGCAYAADRYLWQEHAFDLGEWWHDVTGWFALIVAGSLWGVLATVFVVAGSLAAGSWVLRKVLKRRK